LLAELANAIPRSSYLFGVSWPDVHRTLLVDIEQDGDPYGVMIPTSGNHSVLLRVLDALGASTLLGRIQ
jgi:hypothetical protein